MVGLNGCQPHEKYLFNQEVLKKHMGIVQRAKLGSTLD